MWFVLHCVFRNKFTMKFALSDSEPREREHAVSGIYRWSGVCAIT